MNKFFSEIRLKLKNIKHIEIILALLVVSILVLVYFSSLSNKTDAKKGVEESQEIENSLENRLSNIISKISGVGSVDVMIIPNEEGEKDRISSIIVVAEGAQNVSVRLNILSAIQTLFDVDCNRIQIFAK